MVVVHETPRKLQPMMLKITGDSGRQKFADTASTICSLKSFWSGEIEQTLQNPQFGEKEEFIGTFIKGNSLYNTLL